MLHGQCHTFDALSHMPPVCKAKQLRPHCCRYLANKYADKGLAGTDAKSKALADNWLEAEAQNLNPYTQVTPATTSVVVLRCILWLRLDV